MATGSNAESKLRNLEKIVKQLQEKSEEAHVVTECPELEKYPIQVEDGIFCTLCIVVEIVVVVVLFALNATYSPTVSAMEYGFFRDVSIMIFYGFGFLMTFLQAGGLGAVGYCLVASSLTVQMSLCWQYLITEQEGDMVITITSLTEGLFCAGAVMITYGAVLGKVLPYQLLLIAIIETPLFWLNGHFMYGSDYLAAHDVGGGMTIHMFGAYFGLAVCWFLTPKGNLSRAESLDDLNGSNYNSDLFSLTGTLFLWILWPSFQAAVAGDPDPQFKAMCNTFLSLCGCTVAYACCSRVICKHKLDVVMLQNATLAGGVAMGVAGDLNITPGGAIIGGSVAGIVSCLGYRFLSPVIGKFGVDDICGVHNLHGMPGIVAAIIGVIAAWRLEGGLKPDMQVAGIFMTLGIAIGGGIVAGAMCLLTAKVFHLQLPLGLMFTDALFFECEAQIPLNLDSHGSEHSPCKDITLSPLKDYQVENTLADI